MRQPVKESNSPALSLLVAFKQNSCTLVVKGKKADVSSVSPSSERLTRQLFYPLRWLIYVFNLVVNTKLASKILSVSRLLHRSFQLCTLGCFPQEKGGTTCMRWRWIGGSMSSEKSSRSRSFFLWSSIITRFSCIKQLRRREVWFKF